MSLLKRLSQNSILFLLSVVAYGPSSLWACENLLKASPYQINASQLSLPDRSDLVRAISQQALIFPIAEGKNGFWTIVFDPRANEKNEAYIIQGHIRQGHYIGTTVDHARSGEEQDYFRAVSRSHGIRDQLLTLSSPQARCETLQVYGWVEAKLWLKHGLKVHQVKTLLESAKKLKVYDHNNGDRRYRFQTRDQHGRSIAIVIAEKPNCPNVLITAYEEADDRLH
jgi:uncharacterized DUF497 family protein